MTKKEEDDQGAALAVVGNDTTAVHASIRTHELARKYGWE